MLKKLFSMLIVLITVSIVMCSLPVQLASSKGFFPIVLDIEHTEIDGTIPIDQATAIELNISYWPMNEGYFTDLYYKLLKDKQGSISLEIVDKPEWLETHFTQPNITVEIANEKKYVSNNLIITPHSDSPGLKPYSIEIKATFEDVIGQFGFLTLVEGTNNTDNIIISVDYLPAINIDMPNSVIVTPFNITNVSINITNKGNRVSLVTIEIVDFNKTEAWGPVLSTKQLELDVDEKGKTILSFTADNDFDLETIELKFTVQSSPPSSLSNETLILYKDIQIKNDGSYIEPNDNQVDITILIVVLVAILAIIIIAWILFRKR